MAGVGANIIAAAAVGSCGSLDWWGAVASLPVVGPEEEDDDVGVGPEDDDMAVGPEDDDVAVGPEDEDVAVELISFA